LACLDFGRGWARLTRGVGWAEIGRWTGPRGSRHRRVMGGAGIGWALLAGFGVANLWAGLALAGLGSGLVLAWPWAELGRARICCGLDWVWFGLVGLAWLGWAMRWTGLGCAELTSLMVERGKSYCLSPPLQKRRQWIPAVEEGGGRDDGRR
jgi:hypothetical protein